MITAALQVAAVGKVGVIRHDAPRLVDLFAFRADKSDHTSVNLWPVKSHSSTIHLVLKVVHLRKVPSSCGILWPFPIEEEFGIVIQTICDHLQGILDSFPRFLSSFLQYEDLLFCSLIQILNARPFCALQTEPSSVWTFSPHIFLQPFNHSLFLHVIAIVQRFPQRYHAFALARLCQK